MTAWEIDLQDHVEDYRRKRELIVSLLKDDFEIQGGQGAFYLFLKAPWGTGSEFVAEAIRNNLLISPGNVFSPSDSHFRISFAAEDDLIREGAAILCHLAKNPPV